jgi:hypothetical protein
MKEDEFHNYNPISGLRSYDFVICNPYPVTLCKTNSVTQSVKRVSRYRSDLCGQQSQEPEPLYL